MSQAPQHWTTPQHPQVMRNCNTTEESDVYPSQYGGVAIAVMLGTFRNDLGSEKIWRVLFLNIRRMQRVVALRTGQMSFLLALFSQ